MSATSGWPVSRSAGETGVGSDGFRSSRLRKPPARRLIDWIFAWMDSAPALVMRRVRVVADEWVTAGRLLRTWDGRDREGTAAHSGIYFVRCQSPEYAATRRVVTIR